MSLCGYDGGYCMNGETDMFIVFIWRTYYCSASKRDTGVLIVSSIQSVKTYDVFNTRLSLPHDPTSSN